MDIGAEDVPGRLDIRAIEIDEDWNVARHNEPRQSAQNAQNQQHKRVPAKFVLLLRH